MYLSTLTFTQFGPNIREFFITTKTLAGLAAMNIRLSRFFEYGEIMFQLGKWLVILGLGSFALNLLGLEFKLLMWVDAWGHLYGNLIRAGCVALGALLLFISLKASARESLAESTVSTQA